MEILIFSIIGLIIGSFLNAVIYRVDNWRTLLFERSICPWCKHQLKPADLVPLLSFIFLRGRCRYCRRNISWQYFVVEASTSAMFILFFLHYGLSWELIVALVLLCLLIVIFVYDLQRQLILDILSLPAIFLAVALSLMGGMSAAGMIFAMLIGGGFFLLQVFISKGRWVGGGDIRLGVLMGALLGWPLILVGLFFSYVIGAIFAVFLLATKRAEISGKLAFGPFLIISMIITLFWGQEILAWYLSLL